MQGIAGIIYPDLFQIQSLIHPMLATLIHRGKNESDIYTYKNIQIGIQGNKLSSTKDKKLWVALDGSFDNLKELRALIQTAPEDCTEGELIAHAYTKWGTACPEYFKGAFAFALYDQTEETLFLARDPIGKKPLYWTYGQNHFLFGSELKTLLATGSVAQTPALDALASYLYLGFIPQDMTPIQEVNRLLPGHFLLLKKERNLKVSPYWSYSSFFQTEEQNDPTQILKKLNGLLETSTQSQLASAARPAGCYLGGGLGSSTVAYLLRNQVLGFSIGFEGQNEADIAAARDVAKQLQIRHDEEWITPENFLDDLIPIVWHLDEPLADPNIISTWRLSQIASKKVSTLFSGMGSDELLAGHALYTQGEKPQVLRDTTLQILRQFLIPFCHALKLNSAYDFLRKSRIDPWQFAYLRQNALFNEKLLSTVSPNLSHLFDSEVFLAKFHHLGRVRNPITALLYFDVKARLPDCFMLQFERLTAANGLDWKTPFLSRDLLEFTASLAREDINENWLQMLLKDKLSTTHLRRTKRTRSSFLNSWAVSSKINESFQQLKKGVLVESGLLSSRGIQTLLQSPEDHFRHLFALLILEIWFRLYIEGPIGTRPPNISIQELLNN